MITVVFDRQRAEVLLDCIANGHPVVPGPGGWTGRDLVALAGACHFAAMSHGPGGWGGPTPDSLAAMHLERREAVERTFESDLEAAVLWTSNAVRLVQDDEYDHEFEPVHVAMVSREDGQLRAAPLKGFRRDQAS